MTDIAVLRRLRTIVRLWRGDMLWWEVRRKLWQVGASLVWTVAARRDSVNVRLDQGAELEIPTGDKLARLIFVQEFERSERLFTKRFLAQGSSFLDVGANIGMFTILASSVARDGQIVSIEPSSRAFAQLGRNIALNEAHNVICKQLALSDVVEKRELFVPDQGFLAWSSLGANDAEMQGNYELVDCIPMDLLMREFEGLRFDLVKVDAEGWESRIIAGAQITLAEQEPVMMVEFCDSAAESAGSSSSLLRALIEEAGYEVCRYHPVRNRLEPEPRRSHYVFANLIATKNVARTNAHLSR